jgi:hypothetical protein
MSEKGSRSGVWEHRVRDIVTLFDFQSQRWLRRGVVTKRRNGGGTMSVAGKC